MKFIFICKINKLIVIKYTMIGLSQYVNESTEVNLSDFNKEIESLNNKFTKYTFKLFDKNSEHLFVHDKNSKDWYSPLPDKFVLDKWTY